MRDNEDLLEKGFQLAYFILPGRSLAIRILTGALNKLKAQRERENRRTYWRDKYLKRGITRITREEGDTLQWLIFYESDRYEIEQEESRAVTLKDMVVRYIKSLVRMTSAMSSFHVNIGLHRLLHNYSTLDAQRVYEAVTDRYPGADEYRRAKSVLMAKLEKRFGAMLKTFKSQHGELRFEPFEDQNRWSDLVDLCLKAFIPWSTSNACPVPNNFDVAQEKLPAQLSGEGAGEIDQNAIEINRCHVFIDPVCYGRLIRALALDPPNSKLDLPRIFMESTGASNKSDQPPHLPGLSADERKTIVGHLSAESERRQEASPKSVKIVVDGVERAELDFAGTMGAQFDIEEGAELIEVLTEQQGVPLLLAIHRVAYSELKGIIPSKLTFAFKGGAELILQVAAAEAQEGPRHATVSVSHHAHVPVATARWLRSTPKLALASVAILGLGLGWMLGIVTHRRPGRLEFVQNVPSRQQPTPTPVQIAKEHQPLVTYVLISDDVAVRGEGTSEVSAIVVPAQPTLLQLDLPVSPADAHRSFHAALKPLLKNAEILTENMLTASKISSGAAVTFSVPSVFLQENTDYVVDLRYRGAHGKLEELSTYTFHTVKPN
ncbi:hypothetical protein AYO50_00005 [Acidobacteria bacterium SCGC AG-212-P17]|nr:hypothetical protein AYO50_00005 [Acidobacteria bacterium SCGC AG-212-P17]